MQPCLEEDLVSVDVPDPRDDVLAKQQPFERAAPSLEEGTELSERECTGKRFAPQPSQRRKLV
jgi:hypothetical protein